MYVVHRPAIPPRLTSRRRLGEREANTHTRSECDGMILRYRGAIPPRLRPRRRPGEREANCLHQWYRSACDGMILGYRGAIPPRLSPRRSLSKSEAKCVQSPTRIVCGREVPGVSFIEFVTVLRVCLPYSPVRRHGACSAGEYTIPQHGYAFKEHPVRVTGSVVGM